MTEIVDANTLLNDQFGFRSYGVMAHLPEPQASQVREFHRLIGADDLATKPHCSIDNFWGPDDLDAIKTALTKVAANHPPFETSVDFEDLRIGERGCAYSLIHDDDHFALRAAVQEAMIPLTKRLRPAGHKRTLRALPGVETRKGSTDCASDCHLTRPTPVRFSPRIMGSIPRNGVPGFPHKS